MRIVVFATLLIALGSCNQIQKEAREYNNNLVQQETDVKKRLMDLIYSINNGVYDSAELQLQDLGKAIDGALKSSSELGKFQQDSAFKQSLDNMLLYLRDTAYYHFNDWLKYRTEETQNDGAFVELQLKNSDIKGRLKQLEYAFGMEQEVFARKYEIELVEEPTAD